VRVLLSSIGSRGDVQPLAVLASALRRGGHDVLLVAPPDASPLASALDVPHVACGRDVTKWMAELDAATISPRALVRELRALLDHELAKQAPVLLDAARALGVKARVDVVVTGGLQLLGQAVADRIGAASAYVCFGPNLFPSGAHPPLFVPTQRLPRLANRVLHLAMVSFADRVVMKAINRERTRMGLAAQRHFSEAMARDALLAWDAPLCAMPSDARSFGHGAALRVHPVGALLPAPAPLDAATMTFVQRAADDCTPCVYIGFGSMSDHTPAATFALVDAAAQRAKVRAVWLASSSSSSPTCVESTERVHVVKNVSHAALFPRMHAIVHHAGAGTTAAASRSGAPQIAVPHFLDQPMWSARLRESGVSAATFARARLDARALGDALRSCIDDEALRARARALRDTLAANDPQRRAIDALGSIARLDRANDDATEAIEQRARCMPAEVSP
jgi:vancomycin aglycone glucosyltransferase